MNKKKTEQVIYDLSFVFYFILKGFRYLQKKYKRTKFVKKRSKV